MNDKFQKMIAKKRDLSPVEKSAKHGVLKDLRSAASEAIGSKLDGLKGKIVSKSEHKGLVEDAENPGSDVGAGHMGGMSEGGEVLSPDQGKYEAVDQGSPAEDGEDSSEDSIGNDPGAEMDAGEIDRQIGLLLKKKAALGE